MARFVAAPERTVEAAGGTIVSRGGSGGGFGEFRDYSDADPVMPAATLPAGRRRVPNPETDFPTRDGSVGVTSAIRAALNGRSRRSPHLRQGAAVTGFTNHRVLVAPGEWKAIQQAAHRVKRSPDTIRRWIGRNGISCRSCPGMPHEVSVIALGVVRHGDTTALEPLRQGRCDRPAVRRCFGVAGLSKRVGAVQTLPA